MITKSRVKAAQLDITESTANTSMLPDIEMDKTLSNFSNCAKEINIKFQKILLKI